MRAFYFFELNSIIRNIKNLAAIILLLIMTLYYVFVIEPNY